VQTCKAPVDEARAADVVLADRYVVPLVHVSSVDTTVDAASISAAAQPQHPAPVPGSSISGAGGAQWADWSQFTTHPTSTGAQPHTSIAVLTRASDGLESAAAAVSFAQLLSLCTEGSDTRALADKAVEVGCVSCMRHKHSAFAGLVQTL
jgi:hypothetical protein